MKNLKIMVALLLVVAMTAALFGCSKAPEAAPAAAEPAAAAPAEAAPAAEPAAAAPAEKPAGKIKVALVANQRFGDGSAIDQMLRGLEKAAADFDLEYTTLESLEEANYYDDIAALCEEGYNLIITTFGYMQEAVKQAAKAYPDVYQVGIYQTIEGYDNISTTEWRTQEGLFIQGVLSAALSKNNHVGFILGAEEPAANNEANGFLQGVKWANPDAQLEFMYNNSYEDIDAAKSKAEAMIAVGCDVIGTDMGLARVGAYKAAAEAATEVLVNGDTDISFSEDYADKIPSCWQTHFDADIYNAIERYVTGNWIAGPVPVGFFDGVMTFIDEVTPQFKAANPARAADLDAAWELANKAIEEIKAGKVVVEYITDQPNWEAIKAR